MRENRILCRYCDSFRNTVTIPLVSSASSTGERLETRNAVNNRPCIIGACASPNKNRLHTVPRRNAENDNRGDHMSKYLIEASKKNGLFQPYDPQKYYLVSKEQLSKMILQPFSWAVSTIVSNSSGVPKFWSISE